MTTPKKRSKPKKQNPKQLELPLQEKPNPRSLVTARSAKAFFRLGKDGLPDLTKVYHIVTPKKTLFRSTMVHEVVSRGDLFCIVVHNGVLNPLELTIVPQDEIVYKAVMTVAAARYIPQ